MSDEIAGWIKDMRRERMKPCPFCNEMNCAHLTVLRSENMPDYRWNQRPIEDALRAENNELKSEIRKWEKFHPSDEDLLEMQKQANGSQSLAAQSVYIIVLEQRVRELRSENERYQKLMSKHIVGQCKKCNYMASWPGCTKCGTPFPDAQSALNGGNNG